MLWLILNTCKTCNLITILLIAQNMFTEAPFCLKLRIRNYQRFSSKWEVKRFLILKTGLSSGSMSPKLLYTASWKLLKQFSRNYSLKAWTWKKPTHAFEYKYSLATIQRAAPVCDFIAQLYSICRFVKLMGPNPSVAYFFFQVLFAAIIISMILYCVYLFT